MIKSMTGYGRGENTGNYHWVVEIRSLNHRVLDVFVRLPQPWLFLEGKIKNYIKGKISRGRVDVFVSLDSGGASTDIIIDKTVATNYYNKMVELKDEIGFEGPISLSLLSLVPGIFNLKEDELVEHELWESLLPALKNAVDNLVTMRVSEGGNLSNDINERLDIIENKTKIIKGRSQIVPEEYKKRLVNTIQKHLSEVIIDKERIETEVVLFAEKSNITEELVRLNSHLDQMEKLLHIKDVVGKKMDFIAQEMLREANTIAAKACDYSISKEIIDIKSELEKIREQIQNIE